MDACCIELDCGESVTAKGRCKKHYHRAYHAALTPEQKRARGANQRLYYLNNKERIHAQTRKYQTGFTQELVAALRAKQENRCAICSCELAVAKGLSRLSCDHDHESGKPRGLLCFGCNTVLGKYEKHQRVAGLRIEPYEQYRSDPPAKEFV